MTVQVATNRWENPGNDVADTFPFSGRIFEDTDLVVVKVLIATGVATEMVLNTDYTVQSNAPGEGGNVITTVPLPSTYRIVILRRIDILQNTSFKNQGQFFAELHENAVDRLTMIDQQQQEELDRIFKLPSTETIDPADTILPGAIARASKFLAFDSAGRPIVAAGTAGNLGPVSAFINTLLDDADAAAARLTLGISLYPAVIMYRTVDSGNDPSVTPATWVVSKPDGSVLDTTGTTSQGLQEAINYAAEFGYDLKVLGGGLKPQQFGVAYGGGLSNNPFTTTDTSPIVTVTHAAHGLNSGIKLTFWGLSATVNNIPKAEFEAEHAITVVNSNSYTITLTTPANATGSGGGASCRWQQSSQDVAIISLTAPIIVPPLQGVHWEMHATFNFGGSPVGSPFAWQWNSIMASTIAIHGQVVCANTYGGVMRFKPEGELPQDPFGPAVTSSFFHLPSLVPLNTGATCLFFDATVGNISSNIFEIVEPNGGDTGIKVEAGTSTSFDHNHIDVVDIHSQETCIDAGVSATNAANIIGNTWNVQCDPMTGASVGIEIWGRHEKWTISITNFEGTAINGITLNTSAKKNIIEVLMLEASSLLINDAATEKSNVLILPRSTVEAHKNGTNQTAVVTATQTDITFATEASDTLASFDGTTFTAPYPGTYQILAQVAWVDTTDQALLATSIWKNGSIVKESVINASSTGGGQGASISAAVPLAATDTIKIRARQVTGGNRDVSGQVEHTWLFITRIN